MTTSRRIGRRPATPDHPIAIPAVDARLGAHAIGLTNQPDQSPDQGVLTPK